MRQPIRHFLFFSVFIFVAVHHSNAQRFRVDLGAGYGFGLTSTFQTTGLSNINTNTGVQTQNIESKLFNYNQGFTSHLKLNYFLNQELFLVLGGRHQFGQRSYAPLHSNYYGMDDLQQSISNTYKYDQLDVQIGLGIEKKIASRWSIYLSHGFTFFVSGKAKHEQSTLSSGSLSIYDSQEKETVYRPRFTFGAYGDLGVVFNVSKYLDVFFNTTVQSKNWSTRRSRVKKLEIDGEDQIPLSTTSELETVYEASVSTNSGIPQNSEEPSTNLRTWMPNSGIETVLGLRVKFGAEPKEKELIERTNGVYIQGTFGYGMPMSELTKVSSESYLESVIPTYTSSSTARLYSYGKGLSGQLLIGYGLGKGFAIEIGGVFNNSRYSTNVKSDAGNFDFVTSSMDVNTTYSAWMVRNTYGVKLESQYKRVNAFIRTGMSLGFAGIKESIETVWSVLQPSPLTDEYVREYRYSGNVSIGAYIGLGSSVRISERLDFVAEAVTYIQNWSPRRREFETYTVNGVDQLPNMSTYAKEIEFVSEINEEISNPDINAPQKALKIAEPFSSFMITIGLRLNLFKNK